MLLTFFNSVCLNPSLAGIDSLIDVATVAKTAKPKGLNPSLAGIDSLISTETKRV